MKEIVIYIRYKNSKTDISTAPDILLGDLISQLVDRKFLDAGNNYTVCKGTEAALDHARTLQENGVCHGDILDVGTIGTAG